MNKGFNLINVIIIVLITSVVSAFTTGVILNNNYKGSSGLSYSEIAEDDELIEFINIYSTIVSEYYDDIDKEGMISSAINAMQNYDGTDKKELLNIATEAMLSYLGDDYTTFLNGGESDILMNQLDSSYKGIGVLVKGNEIISVTSDSPAEKAGLLPNDIIYMVDNQIINEENMSLISHFILENGSEYVNVTITRNDINTTYKIKKEKLDSSVQGQVIEDTNIGYINVEVFSENVGDSFESTLASLEKQNIESLIIDLRYNTGGYLDGATDIASLFLKKGETIFSLENKDGNEITKDQTETYREIPIVVIMNGESASASEILAAALKDEYNAIIVGEQSYGKGKVQQTLSTSDGVVAKYTSAKWYTPNGICIDGIGITPDYIVELEYEYNELDEIIGVTDTQYNKALELLSN